MKKLGNLYIVATPIGNREDITQRALTILREVDLIAAEDTRHSKSFLHYFSINTPIISMHEFNETHRIPRLIERLKKGENIALISDAGTPLISDPGYFLVRSVQAEGAKVIPIPGACGVIAALCASGLPTDRFIFEGFLPTKNNIRQSRLEFLKNETRTLIFYEAPHRILKLMNEFILNFGVDREIVVAKELTKTFETFFRGKVPDVLSWLEETPHHQKGEFIVLVHGAPHTEEASEISDEVMRILKILSNEFPLKKAVELTAKITGAKKNNLYRQAVLKN